MTQHGHETLAIGENCTQVEFPGPRRGSMMHVTHYTDPALR